MLRSEYCVCRCFFTHNYFIKEFDLHVNFNNRTQFIKEYSKVLLSRGCRDPEQLIPKLEEECKRRHNLHYESWQRRQLLAREYKPLHPHLYTLQTSFLDPKFVELTQVTAKEAGQTGVGLSKHLKDHLQRIYSFPVFTPEFCEALVEELANYEQSPLPKASPNTMNSYGIKLDELGFDAFMSRLRSDYLTPLTRLLYPDCGGDQLDSHKAFIVTYRQGQDVDLAYHYDNAEVTLNVALNGDYQEGELYFGAMRTEEDYNTRRLGYTHHLAHGLLHRGQQRHGALPITEGVRYNLIMWLRSSAIRNQLCPMCCKEPQLEAVKQGWGDGFTITKTDVCDLV
ncbi:hypothetical protein Pmani_013519 [Petrolisthes manimaculis]|uniref:Fe2OG dioxygenase domain-containing protein n=1 Tax=Petrolisthes manimaculis TaxID=1843537 RepID=A0AAE1UC35_9EUCA|nr:hypothetical protein Pmani_013519 [Petrolisthes manimaculis]